MALTVVKLPDAAQTNYLIPCGTVVYLQTQEYKLTQNWIVNIEAREATNYDNQRRCTDPELGIHLFWVRGPFAMFEAKRDE